MSHRWRLPSLWNSLFLHWRRSYVGSKQEVKDYHEAKHRALQWLTRFRSRPETRVPTDAAAIDSALSHYLFNPRKRLPASPAPPILSQAHSLTGLKLCQQMLFDLEPYFTARNIVRCSERIAQILAFSEKDIWMQHHTRCLQHLCDMIQLAIPRCNISELGTLIWSLGKWGPNALPLRLTEDGNVENLVWRLLERVCDEGVKGDLDVTTISNILNGCTQLNLTPSRKFHSIVSQELKGSVEFAEGKILTRLILSFAQLKWKMGRKIVQRVAETLETKIRAGSHAEEEIPLMLWSFGEWHNGGDPDFMNLCHATETHVIQWGVSGWSLQQYVLLLDGYVKLCYFPSWPFLELIYGEAKRANPSEPLPVWASLLRGFAELGVRPLYIVERCITFLEETEEQQESNSATNICSILASLSLLSRLHPTQLCSAAYFLHSQLLHLTEEDKASIYLAFLHCTYLHGDSERGETWSMHNVLLESCRESWRGKEKARQRADSARVRSLLGSFLEGHQISLQCKDIADGDLSILSLQTSPDHISALILHPDVFHNAGGRITGSHLWRRRLLQHLQWPSLDIDPTDPILAKSRILNEFIKAS